MSIGIYRIVNKINGKCYIGKSANIEQRFKGHKNKMSYGTEVLYQAFRKYGIDNFDFSIIEECSLELLSDREKYWIQYYNSYEKGYNSTLGGDGNLRIDYQKVVEEFKKTGFCTQTAKNLGICTATVVQILDTLKIPHKKFLECRGVNKKPVKQFTKKGEFIQSFDSEELAAKYLINNNFTKASLNTVRGHIGQNCAGKEKTSYGFIWEWA